MEIMKNAQKGLGSSMGNSADLGAHALNFGKRVGAVAAALVVVRAATGLTGVAVNKIRSARNASAEKKAEAAASKE